MPFLEVTIKSKAELAGFQSATDAMERQAGAAKAAGKSHDDLDARIAANRKTIADYSATATPALGQVAGAQNAAAAAAETHTIGVGKLRKVFTALNGVIPGLGILVQAAFSPVGAAISMAVMVLNTFKGKMAEFNAECQRLEEEAAKPLTHRLDAIREGTISAAVGMAALHARLKEAAKGQITLKEATDQAITAAHQQATEAQTLSEALKNKELADLEVAHRAGLISEQRFADAKLAIEINYLKNKRQADDDDEADRIKILSASVEKAKKLQPGLVKTAETAENIKAATRVNLNSLPSGEEVRTQKSEADKALKDFRESLSPDLMKFFEDLGPNKNRGEWDAANQTMSAATGRAWYGYDKVYAKFGALSKDAENKGKIAQKWAEQKTNLETWSENATLDATTTGNESVAGATLIKQGSKEVTERTRALNARRNAGNQVEQVNAGTATATRLASIPENELAQGLNTSPQQLAGHAYAAFTHGNVSEVQQTSAILDAQAAVTMQRIEVAKQNNDQKTVRFLQRLLAIENQSGNRIDQYLSFLNQRNANRRPQ